MARELGLDLEILGSVFVTVQEAPYAVIKIPIERARQLATELGTAVRRCYISDVALNIRRAETSMPMRELIGVKIPDRGSTMAGDFGEILTALFQAASEYPSEVLDPKKWRLKQDRTKPAPKSDVVQLILSEWPVSSPEDRLLCSEVKTKSTRGTSTPIQSAITDSGKDSDGRLAKTLVWLRERAIDTGLETVTVDHLNRFIKAVDHPPAKREFRAVAVICSNLVDAEIEGIEPPPAEERALLVITVPDLKLNYEAVYDAVLSSADDKKGTL